ncbi:MAG TPA: hypothetical protein VNI60_09835 [Pyrinomonadaceae bacterium]|nr:hypothetical protein [Pyrinomonadaceae bacterium]
MTEKCFDIGTIQAFLDGELASDLSEKVACHTAACDVCAIMLAEAEEETAFSFSALENEFDTFVPTNRLWAKINDSIEGNKKTFWQTIFARFSNPSVAAFAGLVIVVGLFAVMLSVKTDDDKKIFIAESVPNKQAAISTIFQGNLSESALPVKPEITDAGSVKISSPDNDKSKFKIVKADFSEKESNRRPIKVQKPNIITELNSQPAADAENENLLGEDSYVKTIATLEKTVDSRKDEVLKPAARFAFERDLAVTDDAIRKMKAEVKKNPKNEAAKDVLRASYQNKIELLNSVAEKSDLMASLK